MYDEHALFTSTVIKSATQILAMSLIIPDMGQ